jgi:hypothetical protein
MNPSRYRKKNSDREIPRLSHELNTCVKMIRWFSPRAEREPSADSRFWRCRIGRCTPCATFFSQRKSMRLLYMNWEVSDHLNCIERITRCPLYMSVQMHIYSRAQHITQNCISAPLSSPEGKSRKEMNHLPILREFGLSRNRAKSEFEKARCPQAQNRRKVHMSKNRARSVYNKKGKLELN